MVETGVTSNRNFFNRVNGMIKIAIIGSGQIGSRHLQALSLIDRPVSIQVVDPDQNSIKMAQERFSQVQSTGNVNHIEYLKNTDELSECLDVVIVATSSNVRRSVLEKLLHYKKVQYLILEKVLFQKIEDLYFVQNLLVKKGTKSWVNCSRRMVPFYQKLKEKFNNTHILNYTVSGSKIGIGCNAIHYLDMFAYLSKQNNLKLFSNQLDKNIITSKRKGFIEFTGTLYGNLSANNQFVLN